MSESIDADAVAVAVALPTRKNLEGKPKKCPKKGFKINLQEKLRIPTTHRPNQRVSIRGRFGNGFAERERVRVPVFGREEEMVRCYCTCVWKIWMVSVCI